MNAITKPETTALAVSERAELAMSAGDTAQSLIVLAASTKDIIAVTNKDGREQCHRAYMVAKDKRIAVEKLGKQARDDANAFIKECVAVEKRLVDLIEPEVNRLKGLRDDFDAEEARIKAKKKAAEEARVAALQGKVAAFEEMVTAAALKATAAEAKAVLATVEQMEIDDSFAEMREQAIDAKIKAKAALQAIVTAKENAERIAAETIEQNKKMQAQLEELQRQNAELVAKNQTQCESTAQAMPIWANISEPVVPFIGHAAGITSVVGNTAPPPKIDRTNAIPDEFGGLVQSEAEVAAFLKSREWKNEAERNHARAICIEFSKFQSGFRKAA